MGPATATTGGVRPNWMSSAARESQLLAGSLALSDAPHLIDVRAILSNSIPPVANELERHLLEAFIARAQQELERMSSNAAALCDPTLAGRAAQILRDRYPEQWTIQRLARELATNRFDLTTEFKRRFDVGVHEYLVRLRVARAQDLLCGDSKVESVAHDVGFRSKKTLYDAHRRVTGHSLRMDQAKGPPRRRHRPRGTH